MQRESGFSLIELLIVLAVIGVLSTLAVPQLIDAYERSRQRGSMADMRSIAVANGTYATDHGAYADSFSSLEPLFMNPVPPTDAWGHAWVYTNTARHDYSVTSLGKDGASGPAAPATWYGDPFEVDLIVVNGAFSQAPQTYR